MNLQHKWIAVILFALAPACASERVPPKSLLDARADFIRTRDGLASQLDPTDVHEADLALQRAETALRDDPDDPTTVDLAIVADRRALIAEAQAATIQAQQEAAAGQAAARGVIAQRSYRAQRASSARRSGPGPDPRCSSQQQQANGRGAQQKLQDMEAKLKDARDTIAKIASVKDDNRGMVITLPGEVLFKTGKFDLKPAAMAKLDQIAEALKGKEQPIVGLRLHRQRRRARHQHVPFAEPCHGRARLPRQQGAPAGSRHGRGQGPDRSGRRQHLDRGPRPEPPRRAGRPAPALASIDRHSPP